MKRFLSALVLFAMTFISCSDMNTNVDAITVEKAQQVTDDGATFNDYTVIEDLVRLEDDGAESVVGTISIGQEIVPDEYGYLYVKFEIDEPYSAYLLQVNLSNVLGCTDNLGSTYDPYMSYQLDGVQSFTFKMKIFGDGIDGRQIGEGYWDSFWVVPSGVIKTDVETRTFPKYTFIKYSIEDNL